MIGELGTRKFDGSKRSRVQVHPGNLLSFLEYAFLKPSELSQNSCQFDVRGNLRATFEQAHMISGPVRPEHVTELARVRTKIASGKGRLPGQSLESYEEMIVRGKVLEYALLPHHFMNVWFGEASFLSKSHEFDDYCRGTDLFLTMEGDGKDPVHVAVDVTTAANLEVLSAKVRSVLDSIDAGTLATPEYFEDHPESSAVQGAAQRSISNIPRVIIPMDNDTFDEFKTLTADFLAGRNKTAETSSIPTALLKCMRDQLKMHLAYAIAKRTSDGSSLRNIDAMRVVMEGAIASIDARYRELKDRNKDRPLDTAQDYVTHQH